MSKKPATAQVGAEVCGFHGQPGVAACKGKQDRMGFCSQHFQYYKFGLITKKGQPVPDFEKKFEHYQAHYGKPAVTARKVA